MIFKCSYLSKNKIQFIRVSIYAPMIIPEKEHLYNKSCSSAEDLDKCDFLKIKYWTYNKYKINHHSLEKITLRNYI